MITTTITQWKFVTFQQDIEDSWILVRTELFIWCLLFPPFSFRFLFLGCSINSNYICTLPIYINSNFAKRCIDIRHCKLQYWLRCTHTHDRILKRKKINDLGTKWRQRKKTNTIWIYTIRNEWICMWLQIFTLMYSEWERKNCNSRMII